jgi:hypothetical protein
MSKVGENYVVTMVETTTYCLEAVGSVGTL